MPQCKAFQASGRSGGTRSLSSSNATARVPALRKNRPRQKWNRPRRRPATRPAVAVACFGWSEPVLPLVARGDSFRRHAPTSEAPGERLRLPNTTATTTQHQHSHHEHASGSTCRTLADRIGRIGKPDCGFTHINQPAGQLGRRDHRRIRVAWSWKPADPNLQPRSPVGIVPLDGV